MKITKKFYVAILAAALSPMVANANLIEGGEGEVTNSWQVTQSCGSCGPTTTAELFIVSDTGAGPFDGPGLSTLPGGWVADLVNPNYVVATGPSVALSGWTEHYLGDILESVTINLFFWDGDPLSNLTFAAAYSRSVNGGLSLICQSFGSGCDGMVDPTGVDYDRRRVSEPGTLALLGLGLFGLAAARRKQKI